ncbi:MAG TPA: LytTR family DNA-binding domain-containing protein [Chryseosolibacter sp.]
MKISCAVLEDEPKALTLITEYIEKIEFLDLRFYTSDPVELLNYTSGHSVELIFLDINLPGTSGFEVAFNISPKTKIIFTTAYSDYAVDSYLLNTVDYLLKPITFDRFKIAVDKARTITEKESVPVKEVIQPGAFFVKSGKSFLQLYWSKIDYIEGLGEYLVLHTGSLKTIIYKRMKEMEEICPEFFIRVHNSFIINTGSITHVESNHVVVGKVKIPIGRKYRQEFMKLLNRSSI